jgi:hypothetical protein
MKSERGTALAAESGKIRVKDTVIALEALGANRTRVHVSLSEANSDLDLERAAYLFEGIDERL